MNFDLKRAFIYLSLTFLIEGILAVMFYVFVYSYNIGAIGGLVLVICALLLLLLVLVGVLPRDKKSYSPNFYLISGIFYFILSIFFVIMALDSPKFLFLMIWILTLAAFDAYFFMGLKILKKGNGEGVR
ncbi:MAG: hypothetical protein HWN65_10715 [Candidatus Helarchaeota archaeon]|nr:hypothetical protein [Candidatus Helarchaeota archaeon]